MKSLKRILLLVLCFVLVATALTSCGGCKHADENGDGICDKCEKEFESVAKDLTLIDKAGAPLFQFVLASDINSKVKTAVLSLVDELADLDIEIDVVEDKEETKKPCEVLIGNVKSRGTKFFFEEHTLGSKGYILKIIDQKLVINGGSESALTAALKVFIEDVLEFEGDEIWDVTMKADEQIDETQSEYDITSVKIAGEDIDGYTIATVISNQLYANAAKKLQTTLYERAGYWLEIVSLDKADKSIVLKSIDKVYGEDSFKVSVSGNQLLVECAFENKFVDTFAQFLTAKITTAEGDVNFEGEIFNKDISFVTYEEFGATNNGKKDNDFAAIYDAHQFANECGQKIIISGNPTYYIGLPDYKGSAKAIPIRTDVDWGNMTLYIDDTTIKLHDTSLRKYNIAVFEVQPTKENGTADKESFANLSLSPETAKIDLGLGCEALLKPTYSGQRIYRRRGYVNANHQGGALHEVIYVDKDGNVSDETPLMWNYPAIDSIQVHYIDAQPLTVQGGTIRTIANSDHMVYTDPSTQEKTVRDYYYSRGISITRSNTLVKNVKHYVEGEITLKEQIEEGKIGVAYYGFFYATFANHVTIEDCILSGRRCFTKTRETGDSGTSGTYDFRADEVNTIVLKNCTQHNFWVMVDAEGNAKPVEEGTHGAQVSMAKTLKFGAGVYTGTDWEEDGILMHWGVGCTNYCKNLQYIDSTLSRFDAHSGLMHGKVIGSTVNVLALTGMGDFEIRDSRIFSLDPTDTYNTLLHLRADYGSVWNGDITIKNFKAFLYKDAPYVVMSTYTNWYFGYECAFPSIEMDNVTYYDVEEYYKSAQIVPFNEGDRVYLYTGSHIKNEPQLHMQTTKNTAPYYTYIDLDKDGFVDGYTDANGDKMPYDNSIRDDFASGVLASHTKVNLNPIKPPKYIKVFNNTQGIVISLDRTDNLGSADGGGFFGKTEFHYAPGKYYTGTPAENAPDDNTFIFN